jgi:NTE family protein
MHRCVVTIRLSCLLITLSSIAVAQPIKNLVFEGAGIRGVAYVGAIKELEKRNLLLTIEKVGGTSAGAIAALTVSLGYNASEIEKIIYNTKLQKFNDGKFFFFGGISRINKNYGWYRGKSFTRWLEKIIMAKTGNADITFKELHDMKFRDLYVTGTSLNNQKLIVFSYERYPQMKVKDAVRISMSIPLWFEAVFIDSKGQIVNKKKTTENFDIMVDGGFTGNYPIFVFDSLSNAGLETQRYANPHTLGFRIDAPEQITYDQQKKGLAPIEVKRFKNYVGAFYNYIIENMNRSSLTIEDWSRTVSISSGSIGPKIKKLSVTEKEVLINNGQQAMKDFFAKVQR